MNSYFLKVALILGLCAACQTQAMFTRNLGPGVGKYTLSTIPIRTKAAISAALLSSFLAAKRYAGPQESSGKKSAPK